MELRNLEVGGKFKIVGGSDKTYQKISNNGDITEYNYCRCLDDLNPHQRIGLMLISGGLTDKRINKTAEIIRV